MIEILLYVIVFLFIILFAFAFYIAWKAPKTEITTTSYNDDLNQIMITQMVLSQQMHQMSHLNQMSIPENCSSSSFDSSSCGVPE